MADWVAKQKFLDEVKRKGMGEFLFEEGVNPPGFNAQIAAPESSTMAPLNGLRTTQEIADAFRDFDAAYEPGTIARGYLMLNAWTKIAATALSVMTQARNLVGRPLMAGMAGHWNIGKGSRSVRSIYEDFAGSDASWQAYLQDAAKHGVIGDTARASELRAVVKDAALNDVQPPDLYSWSIGRALKKAGYDLPVDFYRLSDELGNIFGWENEKAIQAKINPGLSPEQVKAKAAKVVRQIYPIYSLTPKAVKSFRHVAVVGPFVTFPFQVFRTAWNAVGLSLHEIRSTNPRERVVGYKRLTSQIATLSAGFAIEEMGRAALGIDKQQEEDFRRFQPDWSRNSRYLFTAKDQQEGTLSAINLSYTDPYSYMTDPVIAAIRSASSGEDLFETFATTTKELFRPWISEQMLAKAIIEARNGKTDTGREIVNPTDDAWEASAARINHVFKALQPGTVQRFQKRILPAIRNEQPAFGRKLEVVPEVAREVTGFALEEFSFKNGLAFRARAFTDQDRAAESVFHQTISRTQTTTADDLLNAYKEADQRRFGAWSELRKDFLAAVRQGVPVEEAKKVMVARGVTKRDANLISNGRYEPMPLSDQSKKRARERKRDLPIGQINQWRRENIRSLDQ